MHKILAVDDDMLNLRLIKDTLRDFDVITASNGKEGVELALSGKPDVIIMDVMMPVMDGLEATRVIKEDRRTAAIPVLLLTALGRNEDIIKGLDAGADDYIEKPFTPKILRARVSAHARVKTLFDREEQGRKDLEIILEVTRKTTSSLDFLKILHVISERLAEHLKLNRCSILLLDEEKGRCLVAASSDDPDIGGLCIYLDGYPEIRRVIETSEPLIIADVQTDPLMAEVRERITLSYNSLMLIPIIFRDEVIGTILLKAGRMEGFLEREVELCRVIANSSANAIKNASLYERLEEKSRTLEETNERLKEMDMLKSKFLAIASHELKGPLSIITGYLEMLRDGVAGTLNRRQGDLLDTAVGHIRGLSGIVKEMLDIGVIEAGNAPLHLERCDMVKCIGEVIDFMQVKARRKGIGIVPPTGCVEAAFDREKIREVLMNLVDNAVKYTPSCGEIKIAVEDGPDALTVTVADNGQGIPEGDLERVFDDFYRGNWSEEGTGLGLSICKRIVEMHGGRIWAESEPGNGSRFRFTLPKKQQ